MALHAIQLLAVNFLPFLDLLNVCLIVRIEREKESGWSDCYGPHICVGNMLSINSCGIAPMGLAVVTMAWKNLVKQKRHGKYRFVRLEGMSSSIDLITCVIMIRHARE